MLVDPDFVISVLIKQYIIQYRYDLISKLMVAKVPPSHGNERNVWISKANEYRTITADIHKSNYHVWTQSHHITQWTTCDIELLIIMIITHSRQWSHRRKWKYRYVIFLTIIQWSLKHLRLSQSVWQINNKNFKMRLVNNRLEAFKQSPTLKDMDVIQVIKHAQQSRQFSISRASQHEQQSLQIQPERVLLHVM